MKRGGDRQIPSEFGGAVRELPAREHVGEGPLSSPSADGQSFPPRRRLGGAASAGVVLMITTKPNGVRPGAGQAQPPQNGFGPRNPSGNLGLSRDRSRGVSRGVVCALQPLRPSWLGASEESGAND